MQISPTATSECRDEVARRTEAKVCDGAGERDVEFWREHHGVALAWSNSGADDEVMIANALLRPSFHLLLDIAAHFGLDRLDRQWDVLRSSITATGYPEDRARLARATPIVERCLRNMHAAVSVK